MSPRNNRGATLLEAQGYGSVIRITCNFCRQVRHYLPCDMAQLLGDVEVDSLRRRLHCEVCGRRDYVEVEAKVIWGHERIGFKVRRLVQVKTIRRPVWREEEL